MKYANVCPYFYTEMESPVGPLLILATDAALIEITWSDKRKKEDIKEIKKYGTEKPNHKILKSTIQQLKQYFKGKRKDFDIPLHLHGTDFQKSTWKQLQKIPYGKTITYQQQAIRLGDAKKCRAVGMGNSKNPISIIVPCHRVIAKSGKLQGFAGGLEKKQLLLDLEQSFT